MTYWVVVLLCLVPFLISRQAMDPGVAVRHMFLSLFGLGFVGFFFFARPLSLPKPAQLVRVFLWLFGAFLAWNILSLLVAINLQEGLQSLAKQALFFALTGIFAVMAIREGEQLPIIFRAATVVALIHALLGILQYYGLMMTDLLPDQVPPYVLRSNRNIYASAQVLLVPFALYTFFSQKGGWTWVGLATLVLSVFAIILAQTRAAWLSLAAVFLICGIGIFLFRSSLGQEVTRRALRLVSIGIPALIAIVLLSVVLDPQGLGEALKARSVGAAPESAYGEVAQSSVSERLFLWGNCLKISQKHPVLGVGAGNWRIVIPEYGNEGIMASYGRRVSLRPHNNYLQIANETGIPGLLFYLGIWASLTIMGLLLLFRSKSAEQKLLMLTMLGIMAAFAIDIFFSFGNERPENILYLTLAWGIVLGSYWRENPESQATGNSFAKAGGAILLVLFLFNGIFAYARYRYEVQFNLAKAYYQVKNFQRTLEEAQKGKSPLITLSPTATPIELYSAEGYIGLNQLDKALAELQLGLTYHPNNAPLFNNTGTIYTKKGDFQKAIESYEKARQITPNSENVLKNLAINYFNLQDYGKVVEMLEKVNLEKDAYFQGIKEQAEAQLRSDP